MNMINIVGGSGFIGTRLCDLLSENEHTDFRIIDKCHSANYPRQTTIADVRSLKQLQSALDVGAVVINLAAEHRDDVRPANLYYEVNVRGAVNLCAVAEEKHVRTIIFTSSVAVYGFAPVGTDESGCVAPFNDYGKSKAEAEDVFRSWQANAPTERALVIVRPTVVFGEKNRGNVYNLLRQIASGHFVMVGRGNNRKSMAYVENVASFLRFAVGMKPGVHTYNYIDKPDFTTNQLVQVIDVTLGRGPRFRLRLPYVAGLLAGKMLDAVARLTGKSFAISAIRIKKFCSDTSYQSRVAESGFMSPVPLKTALERTIRYEFVDHQEFGQVFHSE